MTYMTITFGIIHGLGYGLSMMTLSVLLNMYFDRYRALTSGIYYSGMSCSGLAFPKFLAYLQDKYGFRGTLLIYGGIITHVTAFGLLLKEPPWMCLKQCVTKERHPILEGTRGIQSQLANLDQNKGSKANGNHEHSRNLPSLLLLLRKPMFYVIVSCAAIGDMIFSVFVSTMVDYGLDKGLSLSDAEFLIIYGSCAQIAGRLLVPLLADAKLIQRSNLVMINIIIGGGSMILMSNMILHAHVLFVCLCVYISLGFLTSMKSVLIADYLGIEWISAIYGVAGVVLLPLTFTTPTIIGFFRDFGGSYDDLYRMYGAILLLLFGFFLFVTCVERKRHHVWAPGQNAQEGSQRSSTEQTRNT
ncbi:monocarboxylate transporter 12 [Ixodes scapularis]|uniref:monocarboxylate transporter 12 n=1 Tax=Ixodes scapularis TaxID=6945 RepID=UPI001A9F287B|nr:monocarboxylate transporter 12 [Ixodes scapularis]